MPSKKHRLKLYADECFPLPSVTYLRSLGISIIHAVDQKSVGKNDRFHLNLAKKLERVLITLDRDFIYYSEANLKNHPGVVVISTGSATPLQVNKVCNKLIKIINHNFVKESLVTISMDKLTKSKNGKVVFVKKL